MGRHPDINGKQYVYIQYGLQTRRKKSYVHHISDSQYPDQKTSQSESYGFDPYLE